MDAPDEIDLSYDAGDPHPDPRVHELLARLKRRMPELRRTLGTVSGEMGYENPVYRFWHRSFKVYALQDRTRAICAALQAVWPERPLDDAFARIIREGTGTAFELAHNARWFEVTRPIVEAFFHARHALEMAVRYGGELEEAPRHLPYGWATLLELFRLR